MGYISKNRVEVAINQFSFSVRKEIYDIICFKYDKDYVVSIVNHGVVLVVDDVWAFDDNIKRLLFRGFPIEVAEGISYGLYTMLKES